MVRALTFGKTFNCPIVDDDDDQVLMHATSPATAEFPMSESEVQCSQSSHGWQFDY